MEIGLRIAPDFIDMRGKDPNLVGLGSFIVNGQADCNGCHGSDPANEFLPRNNFVYDYQTHEASVRMGDAGWENAHRVVDGRVEGIILTESEAAWLRACWLAAAEGS